MEINGNGGVDVAVVGGGLAGLATATLLARRGKSVVLFEKSSRTGGRAATQTERGFSLNLGPHALYRGGAAARVLNDLGIELVGGLPVVGGTRALYHGQMHLLPASTRSLLATRLLPVRAKLEVGRMFSTIGGLDARALEHTSASAWIDGALGRPESRAFLRGLLRLVTYTSDLGALSAGAAVLQLQMSLKGGVMYLDGGWQTLVARLEAAALERGVRFVRGARVVAVEHGEAVRGVRLADGEVVAAAAVVLAADPKTARALTENGSESPLKPYAERSVPVRAACLDLALESAPHLRTNFALGLDRPLYFSVHSACARLAPEGGVVIHAAKYLDGKGSDVRADERELEELVDALAPGWRERIVARRFLPSLTVSNALVTAEGGLSGRPGSAIEGIRGLFVAGDWVGPEGMLADASFASASHAADLISATGHS